MGKELKKSLYFLARLLVFLVAFGMGLLFLVKLDEWAGGFRQYLFATQNWEYLVYLTVFVFGAGYVIKWLVKQEFHQEFVKTHWRRKK